MGIFDPSVMQGNNSTGDIIVNSGTIYPPTSSTYIFYNTNTSNLQINEGNNSGSIVLSLNGNTAMYVLSYEIIYFHDLKLGINNFHLNNDDATSTSPLQNSSYMSITGSYWNGASAIAYGSQIYWIQDSTTPTGHLSFNLNNNGVLTQVASLDNTGYLIVSYIEATETLEVIGQASFFSNLLINGGNIVNAGSVSVLTSMDLNINQTTLAGTTAGNITWNMPFGNDVGTENPCYRKVVLIFNGYENSSTTAQTITFSSPFQQNNIISANSTSLVFGLSLTTLTMPTSMTGAVSGVLIIEGM